jgi:hypothetical protein
LIVTNVWDHELVTDVTGPLLEKQVEFSLIQLGIKISRYWQL